MENSVSVRLGDRTTMRLGLWSMVAEPTVSGYGPLPVPLDPAGAGFDPPVQPAAASTRSRAARTGRSGLTVPPVERGPVLRRRGDHPVRERPSSKARGSRRTAGDLACPTPGRQPGGVSQLRDSAGFTPASLRSGRTNGSARAR